MTSTLPSRTHVSRRLDARATREPLPSIGRTRNSSDDSFGGTYWLIFCEKMCEHPPLSPTRCLSAPNCAPRERTAHTAGHTHER